MKSMGRGRFLLSGKDLFAQIRQPVQSLVQRIVLFGKVETHQMVHRFLKEAGAGNGAYAHVPCQHLAERKVAVKTKLLGVQKNVISSLRDGMGDLQVVQTF